MAEKINRDTILQMQDIAFEEVVIPEWNGMTVRVKSLTGAERDDLEASMLEGEGKKTHIKLSNLRAKMVARTVVDESGQRVFADADIPALSQKNAAALDRIFTVARRLSGMSDEDVEELTKN